MKLYNTKSKKIEELGGSVSFYCCGPTVYGPAHIGNFRTFVVQDVFRRTLEADGRECFHVRNITDVDDKTIKNSIAEGKSLKEFTDFWAEKFHADCESLNLLEPQVEPSAVAHIPEQIELIEKLIKNEAAYVTTDGSVYFKISAFKDYGKLASLSLEGQSAKSSQDSDEYDKENISDFALWKSRKSEDGDNFWNSPWGEGRPGWHTECSAMALKYCSNRLDIHSGGIDLLFPHHENETAQAECACDCEFFKHWFHIEHLLVDGKKMSKSLGNLYTLEDLKKKGFTPREVRYSLLMGHYRKQLNFTFDNLQASRKGLARIDSALQNLESQFPNVKASSGNAELDAAFDELLSDLNTPGCFGKLLPALKGANSKEELASLKRVLFALGLDKVEAKAEEEIPDSIVKTAEERLAAKKAKDWTLADELRDKISAEGYEVVDTPEGYKINKK